MEQDFLSNCELYFSPVELKREDQIDLPKSEAQHVAKVMRHSIGDYIYVTNGMGQIFYCLINSLSKTNCTCEVKKILSYKNELENTTICLPILKSSDRFEFVLEKCVELGITNFIIFKSQKSINKSFKPERWEKIILAAMKQSLRSFKPRLKTISKMTELNELMGKKYIFDQSYNLLWSNYIEKEKSNLQDKKMFLLFGPEGGLTEQEVHGIDNTVLCKLTKNRLRAETAVIHAVSLLTSNYDN